MGSQFTVEDMTYLQSLGFIFNSEGNLASITEFSPAAFYLKTLVSRITIEFYPEPIFISEEDGGYGPGYEMMVYNTSGENFGVFSLENMEQVKDSLKQIKTARGAKYFRV